MELFLARNHSALTHLPIASALLAAAAAVTALFVRRKDIARFAAMLSIVAFLTVIPTLITGIAAGKGRINDAGKPYIQSGLIVSNIPQNTRVFRHQMLGVSGTVVAFVLAVLGVGTLRERSPNRYFIAFLAVLLAVLWGVGSHLGGKDLWGPDTFPGFHRRNAELSRTHRMLEILEAPAQFGISAPRFPAVRGIAGIGVD